MKRKLIITAITLLIGTLSIAPAYASTIVTENNINYAYNDKQEKIHGWEKMGNDWYYFSQGDGHMMYGWQLVNNTWYYFDTDGKMLANTITPDGYSVSESGAWDQNNTYLKNQQQIMLNAINEERRKAGVSELTLSDTLNQVVLIRCKETTQLLSHTRPDGSDCFTVFENYGYKKGIRGENIFWSSGYDIDSKFANDKLMNSEGHRANILNSKLNTVGIGIIKKGNECFYLQAFSSLN